MLPLLSEEQTLAFVVRRVLLIGEEFDANGDDLLVPSEEVEKLAKEENVLVSESGVAGDLRERNKAKLVAFCSP